MRLSERAPPTLSSRLTSAKTFNDLPAISSQMRGRASSITRLDRTSKGIAVVVTSASRARTALPARRARCGSSAVESHTSGLIIALASMVTDIDRSQHVNGVERLTNGLSA
jgi:hypothetical protein